MKIRAAIASVATAGALCFIAVPPAAASIIGYQFSPDASWTLDDGVVEQLSGTFSIDSSTDQLVTTDITITGKDLTDTYTSDGGLFYWHPGYEIPAEAPDQEEIYIDFLNNLGFDQPDPLSIHTVVTYYGLGTACEYPSSRPPGASGCPALLAVSGEVDPVPEPSSLPLLLAGLGLIGGSVYFGRRKPKTTA